MIKLYYYHAPMSANKYAVTRNLFDRKFYAFITPKELVVKKRDYKGLATIIRCDNKTLLKV